MSEVKPSGEWERELGVLVLDPDGWDRTNFTESWAEPITREEFVARYVRSTVMVGKGSFWGVP